MPVRLTPVPKNLPLVEVPIAVGVFEDQHTVFGLLLPVRVRIALHDPQAAAIVERKGDRLHHVRLAGKQRGLEPRGRIICSAVTLPESGLSWAWTKAAVKTSKRPQIRHGMRNRLRCA